MEDTTTLITEAAKSSEWPAVVIALGFFLLVGYVVKKLFEE